MARKQRQARRAQAAGADWSEAAQEANQSAAIASLADEQLFTIDRTGSKTARKKLVKEQKQVQKQLVVSKVEQKLLAKVDGRAKRNGAAAHGAVMDLWGGEEEKEEAIDVIVAKRTRSSTKAKAVLAVPCHPGQSYHPSLDDHQEVLAEALAVETAVLEKQAAEEQFMETGLSEITKSVLMDGEEWADEQDDEDNEATGATVRRQKRKERLTTAQLNKRRRKNQAKFDRQIELRKQSINKGIDKIEKITKALEATAERQERKREMEQLVRSSEPEETVVALTPATVATVPLSDELKGSLRSMKPKGNLLEEHVGRMSTTKQVNEKQKQKRRARPHGRGRMKVFEKYK